MIRNMWYAAAFDTDVQDNPRAIRVLGNDLILFRTNSGHIACIDRYCPHRGCDLELGSIRENALECPFHGWRFSQDGRCILIPANHSAQTIAKRTFTRSYPTDVRGGLVWVYMGSESITSEIQIFREVEDSAYAKLPIELTWQTNFARAVESSLDISHLPFVHPETTGDVSPRVHRPKIYHDTHHLLIYPVPFTSRHPMQPSLSDLEDETQVQIEILFPNQWIIRSPLNSQTVMCTYLTYTPITNEETKIFGFALRNFAYDSLFLDDYHISHTLRVLAQDQRIIESIRPKQAPFSLSEEAHVASDAPTIIFRRWLQTRIKAEESPE